MDAISHASVSVLIAFIFIQFYTVPFFLVLLVTFFWGVFLDYDHFFHYQRKYPGTQPWNIPKMIKIYFQTLKERDEHIYHTWLHEPFGLVVISAFTVALFVGTNFYPELTILALSCLFTHFIIDLLSGKMKPLAPFSEKYTLELKILPPNHFTAASISLITFLSAVFITITFF